MGAVFEGFSDFGPFAVDVESSVREIDLGEPFPDIIDRNGRGSAYLRRKAIVSQLVHHQFISGKIEHMLEVSHLQFVDCQVKD